MSINFRQARQGDAPECGRIIFEAFKSLADQHGFPPDFPSVDAATGLVSMLMATPGFHDVLAEEDHQIMGVKKDFRLGHQQDRSTTGKLLSMGSSASV